MTEAARVLQGLMDLSGMCPAERLSAVQRAYEIDRITKADLLELLDLPSLGDTDR